jgi:hypothetical protein
MGSKHQIASRSVLVMILLMAAYVRLAHPDLSWFGIDQARDVHTALGIVSGRSFPLLGVEIAGGPAHTWGPAYFYLIAIPFAVSRAPAFAVAVLSATTVAGLLMTYRLGLVFFGREVGLLSAALVATYPLAVIESKALWNVAPVPVFTVIFFYALCSLVVHGHSVMIIAALTALAVLVQLHLSALSLVIVLVVTLALFRPRMRGIHLVSGLGVLLALMLPYLIGQWLSGFADLRVAASSGAQLRLRGPLELGELALRDLFASPDVVAGIPAPHETWRRGMLLALHRLEAWALVLGLAFCGLTVAWRSVWRGPRDGSYPGVVLVTLGFAIPLLMLGARSDIKPYYFNVAYPMPFIAAALFLSRGIDWVGTIAGARARRALWAGLAMVMALTVMVQVDFHRQLWRTIRTTGAAVWTPGRLELMAIRYKAELARILVNDFGADSLDVFLRVHGSRARDWLEDKGYFFESITAAAPPHIATRPSPSLHYAVVRDEGDTATLRGGRIARAGPYTVAEYRPLIEYSTWQCARPPNGDPRLRGHEAAADWTPVQLPTTGLPRATIYGLPPHRSWGSAIVSCRGTISGSSPRGQRLQIVVSLRAATPGDDRVEAFHLDGVSIAASRVLAHSTFAAHNVDAVFDVTKHLRDGPNELIVRISSRTSRFDLDVYEIHG